MRTAQAGARPTITLAGSATTRLAPSLCNKSEAIFLS